MKKKTNKKELAIKLRKKGKSIRAIENELGVAKSTLSGWLRNIKLSKQQKEKLHRNWLNALVEARKKASEFHRKQRLRKIREIKREVNTFISGIALNKTMAELIFAVFYLAEGSKTKDAVEIASANPKILFSFLKLFKSLYPIEESRIRCYLHLRLDQPEEKIKDYWSKLLSIPKSQFIKSQFDKRTNSPSYKDYRGVCTIYYCDVNIQRRIIAVGERLLQKIKTDMDG